MFCQSWRGLDHKDEDTVLTVFAFSSPPKLQEGKWGRLTSAEHKAAVTELLGETDPDSTKCWHEIDTWWLGGKAFVIISVWFVVPYYLLVLNL